MGQLVRCPTCRATLRVPSDVGAPATAGVGAGIGAGVGAAAGARGNAAGNGPPAAPVPPPISRPGADNVFSARPNAPTGRRYGFPCPYCSSRLEATEAMAAQEGACPTCGSNIIIPILDRYGRLIDPLTKQIIKPDPHPVHAYAAAGVRAPQILRDASGVQMIRCPRCQSTSPISSNNCKRCGVPFTMEGTTAEAGGASNGFAVASLVLGILGLFPCSYAIPAVLALVFGIVAYVQVSQPSSEGGGKGLSIAGMSLGALGILFTAYWFF